MRVQIIQICLNHFNPISSPDYQVIFHNGCPFTKIYFCLTHSLSHSNDFVCEFVRREENRGRGKAEARGIKFGKQKIFLKNGWVQCIHDSKSWMLITVLVENRKWETINSKFVTKEGMEQSCSFTCHTHSETV